MEVEAVMDSVILRNAFNNIVGDIELKVRAETFSGDINFLSDYEA